MTTNAAEPLVTVVRSRTVPGGARDGAIAVPLGAALVRRFRCDAHFQPAVSPLGMRLTNAAIGTAAISIGVLVFDADCPEVHGTPKPAPPDWRNEFADKVEKLAAAHPGPFVYFTRGGARVVYLLVEPFRIATPDDAAEWRARYFAACDQLGGVGIEADRSCADWQRLFRLPHATRDAARAPEQLPTIGDVAAIGVIDLPVVSATPHALMKAPTPPAKPERSDGAEPAQPQAGDPQPRGSLYDLCEAAGLIVGPGRVPRSFRIVCPRNAAHTIGQPGDGATLLYLSSGPAWMNGPGAIDCKHAGCAHMRTAKQWRQALKDRSWGGASRRERGVHARTGATQ